MTQPKEAENQSKKMRRIRFPSFKKKKSNRKSIELNDDEIDSAINTESKMDEIDKLVNKMRNILSELNATCHTNNDTHHSMDLERFQKLIDWVDYNESHLCLLKQAWNDESFWPFLSTEESEQKVANDMQTMLIRLSNSKPGAITVTRKARRIKVCTTLYTENIRVFGKNNT